MKNVFRKTLIVFTLLALVVMSCNRNSEKRIAELENHLASNKDSAFTSGSKEQKPEGPLPKMEFETTEHDFGTITEGDIVEYTYKFKNTGDAPLIIQGAQGSCGCTVPDWTKEPIPVGETGYVKAKFDSHGKHEHQTKTVTVTANTFPKQTELHFTAMVKSKEAK